MKICDVAFSDQQQFKAVKNSIESAKIEGFIPTKHSVEQIKSVIDGKMTIDELIAIHTDKDNVRQKHKA